VRSEWKLVPNPAYAGKTARILKAACHDGSPCIDIRCRCGVTLHQHESRTATIPDDAEVATRCVRCRRLLVFPPGYFVSAFAQLRADGWIE
jgi:hypothetical protein